MNTKPAVPPIHTVSILGAGIMGRGIAEQCVRSGLQVRIADANPELALEAVHALRRANDDAPVPRYFDVSSAPIISVAECDRDLAAADLIIEAVPENVSVKIDVLSRVELFLRSGTIIASNSSSIPMSQLAAALKDPTRFCGLHFCHPVSQRPLVEVIGAETTSPESLDRAFAFASSLGMSPIVVRDSPGFLLNRLLVSYLNEALELLLEGAEVAALNRAAKAFGMPQGPLALFDDFGIDVALAVGRSLFWTFPDRIVPSELLIAMYKSGLRGRKAGGGFFLNQADADAGRLAPHSEDLISKRRRSNTSFSDDDISRRLFLPMLLEAIRTLNASLVGSAAEIDRALRDGLGMTKCYQGLFGWADSVGAATIIDWLRPLEPLGKRFEPTPLLQDAAAANGPITGLGNQAA